MNSFIQQNRIGKKGEADIQRFYRQKGCCVEDVSNNKEYQSKDIDLIINSQTVEIKSSNTIEKYNSVVIELVSNDTAEYYKKGWFETSETEVIIFYSLQTKTMYQCLLEELRQYYSANKDKIRQKRTFAKEFDNIVKPSVLAFIPLEELEQLKNFRKIQID